VVLGFALLAALGGAGLLYAAHGPLALVVFGAVGIFAAALKLLDSMIELSLGSPATMALPWFDGGQVVPAEALIR
jgi:hypothetical protein